MDFSRLSESILQRAYDAELVPVAYVTQAALSLCTRLRSELEEARGVIRSQEQELEKYGLGGRGQAWPRAAGGGATTTTTAATLGRPGVPGVMMIPTTTCATSLGVLGVTSPAPLPHPAVPLPAYSVKDPLSSSSSERRRPLQ